MRSVVARMTSTDGGATFAAGTYTEIVAPFEQPYTNHNGGDAHFGKDGYLYLSFGDGGSGGDPLNHGQNKNVFFGKLLRIDVDNPQGGKAYGIPADNPFAIGWRRARHLRVRPPQPVPLQRRQPDRPGLGRRRGAEPLGGGRQGHPRRQLRLALPRGQALLQPDDQLPDRGAHRSGVGVRPHDGQLDHRRRRVPRQRDPLARRPLRRRRLRLAGASGCSTSRATARARRRRSRTAAAAAGSPSARTSTARSTRSPSRRARSTSSSPRQRSLRRRSPTRSRRPAASTRRTRRIPRQRSHPVRAVGGAVERRRRQAALDGAPRRPADHPGRRRATSTSPSARVLVKSFAPRRQARRDAPLRAPRRRRLGRLLVRVERRADGRDAAARRASRASWATRPGTTRAAPSATAATRRPRASRSVPRSRSSTRTSCTRPTNRLSNQLRTLEHIGMFDGPLPGAIETLPKLSPIASQRFHRVAGALVPARELLLLPPAPRAAAAARSISAGRRASTARRPAARTRRTATSAS